MRLMGRGRIMTPRDDSFQNDAERRLVRDLIFFRHQCRLGTESLADGPVAPLEDFVREDLPEPLALAMNALLNGVAAGGM